MTGPTPDAAAPPERPEPTDPTIDTSSGARGAKAQSPMGGLVWSIFGTWGQKVVVFVMFIVLANLLDPRDFGLVALGVAMVGMSQAIFMSSFGGVIVQRADLDDRYCDTVFWMVIGTAVLMTAGIWIAAGVMATAAGEAAMTPVLRVMGLVLVVYAMGTVQQAWLSRRMAFRSVAIRNLISVLVGGAAGVAAALAGWAWWSLVLQQAVTAGVATVILWVASGWRPHFAFDRARARDSLDFIGWMVGWGLLVMVERYSDLAVVTLLLGATAAGLYSTAQRIAHLLVDLLSGAVGQVFLSVFSRLQEDKEALADFFYLGVRVVALVALPAFCGLAAVADLAILVLVGERWIEAAPLLAALSIGAAVTTLTHPNFTLMTGAGKTRWVFFWALTMAASNLAAVLVASSFGALAVAIAIALRSILLMPLTIFSVARLMPVSAGRYLGALLPAAVATAAMAATVLALRPAIPADLAPSIRLAALVAAGGAVYCAVILAAFRRSTLDALGRLRTLKLGQD
ncbi:MAG: lipopolysaccharide biosynthesis protein [Azospirillaceae bacterium]